MPFLSTVGVFRLLGVTFGQSPDSLAPFVRQFARATSFRATGYRAAADEIMHIHDSAAEVRATRRKLTIPVVVVTAGRGTDPVWRDLQRDQVALSQRGCQIIAEQSGHAVVVSQPQGGCGSDSRDRGCGERAERGCAMWTVGDPLSFHT